MSARLTTQRILDGLDQHETVVVPGLEPADLVLQQQRQRTGVGVVVDAEPALLGEERRVRRRRSGQAA